MRIELINRLSEIYRSRDKILNGKPIEKWRNIEEYLLFLRHLKAYDFTKRYIKGKLVLDVGCGTGYGDLYLSKHASKIIGIDISKKLVKFLKRNFQDENLEFKHVNRDWVKKRLPFKSDYFDVCVSFQVLEHINPIHILNFLEEIKRVLKHQGILILSTPNSKTRLLPFQKPWNPQHCKEYNFNELKKILEMVFDHFNIYCLKGDPEIQTIELNRVKQNPFKFYFMYLPGRVVKRFFPRLYNILKRIGKFERRREDENVSKEPFNTFFSINNYHILGIDTKDPKKCLDFIAICKK